MIELIYVLVMTHITIVSVTIYLHRGQAHRGLIFNPVLSHFMRFWLWLTTGMVTKQWVAIHRKHHRFTDQPEDPHSPVTYGIKNIFFRGVYYYYLAAKDARMTVEYGKGTPDDWIERQLYTPHCRLGISLMLVIDLLLFGPWGLLVWGIQMIWIPFWAAGVVNGIGHWFGYRNGETRDNSTNFSPWGIIIGGEELHNNHHLDPASPKLSNKWWEFDIGWFYIQLFKMVGLLKLKNTLPF
jgi:stearoyl-CoA desaturase (delta-9 desaturase)